jgi:hypothetical protein
MSRNASNRFMISARASGMCPAITECSNSTKAEFTRMANFASDQRA